MEILTILAWVVPPLLPFVNLYNTAATKMCLKKTSDCPKLGELIMEKGGGGLCYIPCDKSDSALTDPHKAVSSKWKSDGETVCYKQYAGWENNGQGHTLTSITKRIVTTPMATPLTDCPSGYTKRGTVCYRNCPANGTDGSYWESDGTHGCYKRPKTWPGNTTTTHLQHDTKYSPAKPIDSCPSGYTKRGAVCYQNCPANGTDGSYWETDGTYGCYKRPNKWPGNTTTTHLQHDTKYSPAKPIDSCPTNKEKDGALCYDKCNTGYTGIGPVCWKVGCESGYRDDGAFCTRDIYTYAKNCTTNTRDKCWGAKVYDGCPGGYRTEPVTCFRDAKCSTRWDGCCWTTRACSPYGGCSDTCWGCPKTDCTSPHSMTRPSHWSDCAWTTKEVYTTCSPCNSGYTDGGVFCTRPQHTYAKPSYGRGVGTPLICAPGREMRGALCYDNCNVYNNGTTTYERRNDNLEFCSTACPSGFTNIGIGGCQRPRVSVTSKPLECAPGREALGLLCYDNCNVYNNGTTSYERRKDNLEFCSTACPSDFTNIGIGGCQRPRWHADSTSMVCPSNKRQYSTSLGLCYDDCNVVAGIAEIKDGKVVKKPGQENNNYTMQSAGLCSQECPSGVLMDFGVGCTRQQFNRGTGVPGWSLRFKERKVPYGTK